MSQHTKWRAIPSHPCYQANPQGKIRRRGRVLKTFMVSNGLCCTVSEDNCKTTLRVARVVGEMFCPDFKPSLAPVHLNGKRHDCRACNLKWVHRRDVTGAPYSKNPR